VRHRDHRHIRQTRDHGERGDLLVYLACCLGVRRLRRLNAGAADNPFVMPAGRCAWLAAGLTVALLARATAQAWLLTGGARPRLRSRFWRRADPEQWASG
jgi:hypothetical protein